MVSYTMNTSENVATGFSPFELRYARKPRTALDFTTEVETVTLTKQGAKEFVGKHQELIIKALNAVKLAQARMKLIYNEKKT
jgi:hypothetical protein